MTARSFLAAETTQGTIKQTPLQIKRARLLEADAAIQNALAQAKRAERAADFGPIKRRTNDHLARYLALPLRSRHAIRPEEGYRARSYNLARQVVGLVDHLFVRYPVPVFLYRTMLTPEGLALVCAKGAPPDPRYREWFLAVARGDSFARLVRDEMRKREAHLFLTAPDENDIGENLLWARAAASGLPRAACDFLVQRLDSSFRTTLGDRLPDLLRFYGEAWPEMRGYDANEITDYVRVAVRDPEFSFRGRTFNSVRRLCAEWHRTAFRGTVKEYRSWPTTFEPWTIRAKGVEIRAEELWNNRLLADEGTRQRHCVLTYAARCIQGRSAIVSMRWTECRAERDRLTLEIHPDERLVVQIRGRFNRGATDEEMRVIRQWAGERALRISAYA